MRLVPSEWKKYWFSDEVMVRSHPFIYKLSYWSFQRRPEFDRENKQQQGIGVMFWGLISFESYGPLVPIEGSVTKESYLELLQTHFRPELAECGYVPHFVQDNAPSHKARIVMDWLENQEIILEKWPARSSDLNPIENAWFLMKHELVKKPVCNTREDIIETVLDIWDEMTDLFREHLVKSFVERIVACHRANGNIINK